MSRERRATIYSLRLTTWQYMKARWSLPGLQLLRKEFGCRSRLITRNSRLVLSSFAMLGGRTSEEWIAQYASSHQHPVNRFCHTFGIPLIVISLLLFVASIFVREILLYAVALFIFGWTLQFVGHIFEGKRPEFFHDWRFLFVGLRWWWAKVRGRA